jgi:methylation protein EvaC
MKCRVCKAECKQFLSLGYQPIANKFLTEDQFNDEFIYPLTVMFCPTCLTIQIGECPSSSQVFNKEYSFFTGTSSAMKKHFADLAEMIKARYMPKNGCIMEIGSNDGTFLKHFKDNVHLGFDPSESVNKVARSNGVRVYPLPFQEFSDVATTWPKTDVFVSCNAFAHIEERREVLKNIKRMLAADGIWIDEEPYFGNVFDNIAYDQFYNEHIFYTSIGSMKNTLQMFDLDIEDYEMIWPHGGSIRYFIRHKNNRFNKKVNKAIKHESFNCFDKLYKFGQKVNKCASMFRKKVVELDGCVGYGASAKSTTILNYCKIGPDIISKIYDTTPEKQGKFSPGMHIPIVPYERFAKDNPQNVVLFIWNHIKEIMAKEAEIERNWILPIGEVE